MIFHFMAAQKLIAEHYEIDFDIDIPFKCSSKFGCRTLYNRILHDFSL